MRPGLLHREVLPFLAAFTALVCAALGVDGLLHALGADVIGRYLGIPGTLLILGSFGYSLRKRRLLAAGLPARLLALHERMAWGGAMLVLVHAGIHFNALLAWLAVGAMLLNVASGLTGKFLLTRARRRVALARQAGLERGLSSGEVDELARWDNLTLEALRGWRSVHYPVSAAFAILALAHIVSILLLWSWR